MKRFTFITIGIIFNLLVLILPVIYTSGWGMIGTYFIIILVTLISGIIHSNHDRLSPSFWFLSMRCKKIHHNKFGKLYSQISYDISDDQKCLEIFEQKFLYMSKILSVEYTQGLNCLIYDTKEKLDELYKERLRKGKKVSQEFENWDGYLDIESKRDDKLNKLGV